MTHPTPIPELIDGLPNISGWAAQVKATMQDDRPIFLNQTNLQWEGVRSAFAIALHMHQPTIPAGWDGALISNLQAMFERPNEGDNHNAGPFAWCYSRIGNFVPELVEQGCNPRVMLDYSGNLLWGLRQMDKGDVLDNLKRVTCDPTYQPYVEWLGTMWSHAVIPSTPIADIKLHMLAWQQHFAAVFGWAALARVRGFSMPEMHLPNHPDTLFTFVQALRDCGYRWVMVQEHTVEQLNGAALADRHLPHQLMARNSQGETVSITALIKTQGSDTKLVAQMQPYYEAKTLQRQELGGISVPLLVTQIGDGENGGVMMNEFPGGFRRAWLEIQSAHDGVVGMNGTEYLEFLAAAGVKETDFPTCQAVGQHLIWQRVNPEQATPEAVAAAIADLQATQPNFHMDGASWTNHLSWVQGYDMVLKPMYELSRSFHQVFDAQLAADPSVSQRADYRSALLHNLLLQTSCFRYWGEGTWTDYAQAIYRRGMLLLANPSGGVR
jgi:hypothetical protein